MRISNKTNIVIVDYRMGNINSIKRKLNRLSVEPVISSSPEDILSANKIILPGVGHFSKAMENINVLNLFDALNEAAQVKKIPVLGICLGMQLFASRSEEGHCKGLNWIKGDVVRFDINDKLKYKIPHIGWNRIDISKDSQLLSGLSEQSEFYFVHSYHYQCQDTKDILSESEYEYKFTSAVEKDNIFGVQFHPEKSHDVGEKLLKNFIEL